jgi:hypothetical protein
MFSRDDFDRGARFPLLWVFGPLILGALLVTGLGIAARATQGFPNLELAEEVREAAAEGDPLLAEVTGFSWDRVCIFPADASKATVDALLGFEWGVVGGDPNATGRWLFVFVEDERVVTHFFLRTSVEAPAEDGDCRAPDDEETRL